LGAVQEDYCSADMERTTVRWKWKELLQSRTRTRLLHHSMSHKNDCKMVD
jgi:hypothetical protein